MTEATEGVAAPLRVVRSMVRSGHFVVELEAPSPAAGRHAAIVANGIELARADASGQGGVELRAAIPAEPLTTLEVQADGESVAGSADHAIARLISADYEAFQANVMRKETRIKDPETLVEAARQSYLRFETNLAARAVSLAVIGYRYVERPSAQDYAGLRWIEDAGNALRQGIDESVDAEARWATSIDVMLYQVCAMAGEHDAALKYLHRLYAGRRLVDVEPMCAYNVSLGVLLMGYLYYAAGRHAEATSVWAEYEPMFVNAVVNQPKRLGTMRELGVIWRNSFTCISGMTAAQRAAKGQDPDVHGATKLSDPLVATATLRVNAEFMEEAKLRMAAFIDAARTGKIALIPGNEAIESPTGAFY